MRKLIKDMETHAAAIKRNALELSWYLRGGASYEDILNMSTTERDDIWSIVEDHMETTKKTQLPFF